MNVFIASGNLGKDMEIRVTPNGKDVGSFPLPVKQGFGDYQKTSWVDCKILGERARKLEQYLVKGKEVTVSGEFVYEEWEKDGVKKGRPVVIVREIDMHGGSQTGNTAQQKQSQPSQQPAFDDLESVPF